MPKLSDKKKLERKERIIDTAFELFAAQGYSNTGMRDIMDAANISKGGIYVYFDSKLDILLAIVERMDAKRHKIKELINLKDASEEKLSAYLSARLKNFQITENQKWSRIALEFWSLPKDHEALNQILEKRKSKYQKDIEAILLHGVRIGKFKKDINMEAVVYQIMCTIDGAALLSSALESVITDNQIEATVAMYLSYLKE